VKALQTLQSRPSCTFVSFVVNCFYASGTAGHPGNSDKKVFPMYPRYSIPMSLVKKPSAVNLRRKLKNSIPCPKLESFFAFFRYAIRSRISFC